MCFIKVPATQWHVNELCYTLIAWLAFCSTASSQVHCDTYFTLVSFATSSMMMASTPALRSLLYIATSLSAAQQMHRRRTSIPSTSVNRR